MSIDKVGDFFSKKKSWSMIKDKLLEWYLTPYFAKISHTTDNFYFIDGFAGQGKFDDGNLGSPLIAEAVISNQIKHSSNKAINFKVVCFENDRKIFKKLKENTNGNNNFILYNSSFADTFKIFINSIPPRSSIFVYLDPFGINGLISEIDDKLIKLKKIKIEMLINFNSFGCYRECCRLLKYNIFDEYFNENQYLVDSSNSLERMDNLLGGNDWQKVIINKEPNHEYELSKLYCIKMHNHFKYVFNMPVRLRTTDLPKYRMIFCSNSSDGALLMANDMFLRLLDGKENNLFRTDIEGNIINDISKELNKIFNLIPCFPDKSIRLNDLIADFYQKIGIFCKPDLIIDYLKKLELNEKILVSRFPELTKTGKRTNFWSEKEGQRVTILKKIEL